MPVKSPILMLAATLAMVLHASEAEAAKPSREVLPGSTKFSYSVANQQDYVTRWEQTELGRFLQHPALKPFLDDLPRQFREGASDHPLGGLRIDLGLELADLKELGEGEATWALVHPEGGVPSRVMIADVADRDEQLAALLDKVATAMKDLGATQSVEKFGGHSTTVYDIPSSAEVGARKLYHVQVEDQIVFAEDHALLSVLVNNLTSDAKDTLEGESGYQEVIERCRGHAGDDMPDAVLYFVPVDFSEALQELAPKQEEQVDEALSVARKHNFDAISAVGAFLDVAEEPFDFHLRIAVHAPKPWKNGVRILSFPNQTLTLFPWIHGKCDGYSVLNVDFDEFSKSIGPLFDDVYGQGEEGLYDDLKYTLKDDPDGPQVDIDRELFGLLAPQVTLMTWDQLPVTPDSPRRLVAFRTTDEAALAAVVKKVLEADPNTEPGTIAGQPAYFSYVEEESDAFGFSNASERSTDQPPSFITCVTQDHLYFATDSSMLEEALKAAPTDAVTHHADHRQLAPHFEQIGDDVCVQFFGRLSEMVRVSYELLRAGQPPNAARSFGGLINNIALGEPPEVDLPELDGSRLPPFDTLQQDLGLVGFVGTTTEDGWYLEGFVIKRR